MISFILPGKIENIDKTPCSAAPPFISLFSSIDSADSCFSADSSIVSLDSLGRGEDDISDCI